MQAIMNTKLKLFKNQKGLTLVELLAVIVILGVIAAIAVPAIGGVIGNAKKSADKETINLLRETAVRYLTDTNPNGGTTPPTTLAVTVLVSNGYLKVAPVASSTDSDLGTTAGSTFTTIPVTYTAATGWSSDTATKLTLTP
jgi:type IV pilus assembly protein PilA